METDKDSSGNKPPVKFQVNKNSHNSNEDDDQNMMYTNDVLYDLINKKMSNGNLTSADSDCNLMISSVNSLNEDTQTDSDTKKTISGLYLRNPRGKIEKLYKINQGFKLDFHVLRKPNSSI